MNNMLYIIVIKYVSGILLFEIFHFYIQIRSVYKCFNVRTGASNRIR